MVAAYYAASNETAERFFFSEVHSVTRARAPNRRDGETAVWYLPPESSHARGAEDSKKFLSS